VPYYNRFSWQVNIEFQRMSPQSENVTLFDKGKVSGAIVRILVMCGVGLAMTESTKNHRVEADLLYDVISGTLTNSDWTIARAAELLHLSRRQVYRLKAAVRKEGRAGLDHGNQGRRPINAAPIRVHKRVVRLYKHTYGPEGYGLTHFAEALGEEHGISLSRETVRKWLRADHQGPKPRRFRHHRLHRERRARKGQMLFLDGSPHEWLGPHYSRLTLILATDDATGEPLYGLFAPQETLNACFEVLYHVMQRFGLPQSLYLDRASQFKTTRHGGLHRLQNYEGPTAFQIAMARLKVEVIFAYTPQARGRGERMNESFQGRLVAELIHNRVTEASAATKYLNANFIPRYARRFGVSPRDPRSAFRPIPAGMDLRTTLCVESVRTVESDNTIRLHGRRYQLRPPVRHTAFYGARVKVQEWFDGSVHTFYDPIGEIPSRLIPHIDLVRAANRHRLKTGETLNLFE